MNIPMKQIVLVIIIFAILVNLGPFGLIGHPTQNPGYQTILQLADAGVIGSDIIRQRRGLYLALRHFAPGAKVIIPKESNLDTAQIYGRGRARHVSQNNYNPEAIGINHNLSDMLSNYIVTRDVGGDLQGPGPFLIAIASKNPQTIIFLKHDNAWYLVDSELLPMENF